MARSISLSDEAFRTLRAEKLPMESDSDVVLRLARAARRRAKDITAFTRKPPQPETDWESHERFLAAMRSADVARARALGLLRG